MSLDQEQNSDKKSEAYSPAYTAFRTVKGFIDGLDPRAIPRKIDKSMMRNLSGGAQRKLWSGLVFLGLTHSDGAVTEPLRELVVSKENPEQRKKTLAEIIEKAYAPIIKDLDIQSATAKQLQDAFRAAKVEGATLTDSIRFYVHARKECGLPVSPYISARKPRSANGSGSATKIRIPKSTRAENGGSGSPPNSVGVPQTEKPGRDAGGEMEQPVPTGMMRLPLYFPGKPMGCIEIHADLVEADVEMIHAILKAYAERRSNKRD